MSFQPVTRASSGAASHRSSPLVRAATDVPLGVVRASADALAHARSVEAHGNPNAASDVGVAVALLKAGAQGARLNVEINLGSVTDGGYADRVRTDLELFL